MDALKARGLIVDFAHGGVGRDGVGVVIFRRKGGDPGEIKTHINQLLELQHVKLQHGMKVWLADLDRDISGNGGAPLAATIRWDNDEGWSAGYLGTDVESL
jgi:hypothetical protein